MNVTSRAAETANYGVNISLPYR